MEEINKDTRVKVEEKGWNKLKLSIKAFLKDFYYNFLGNKSNKKYLILIFTIFIVLMSVIRIIQNYIIPMYNIHKVKNEIVNNIKQLEKINDEYRKYKGDIIFLKNFDLSKDTLPFKNFRTLNSKGGNCEGYSMFEKLYYEKKLNDYLRENRTSKYTSNLGDIKIPEEDISKIYGKEAKTYYLNYKKLSNTYKEDISYDNMIYIAYGIKHKDKDTNIKIKQDYSKYDFENPELKNIITDIDYIHINKNYTCYKIDSYYSKYINDPMPNQKEYSKYRSGEVELIINNLKNNKPVVVGINSRLGGHALLGYAYQMIDDNNIKIFVKDSNIPLINKDNPTNEVKLINQDIKDNVYIMFTKNILKKDWSYIYQPEINYTKMYYEFNSFIPGTELWIIP